MPHARTHRPARFDRLAVAVLFALLCVATLSIWMPSRWPLLLVEAGLSVLFLIWFPLRANADCWKDSLLPLGCLIALTSCGFLQYFSGRTNYAHATLEASLQWFAVLLIFALCAPLFHYATLRNGFLTALVWMGTAFGVMELAGAARPSGDFLWLVPTGRERLYGVFPYYNNFAQFQELVLPIAVFRAIVSGGGRAYGFAAGILYASVIVSGSRAGAILATAEVFAVLAITAATRDWGWKAVVGRLSLVASVAGILTIVAWGDLSKRFEQDHPLAQRGLLNRSSLDMLREHPLLGFGLGTYPYVYPSFARFDVGRYVNHAHNDWAEWATEGGLPFALCLLAMAAAAFGPAVASSWGVGLIAVGIHAMVDYPFQRFGLEAWIFVLLAAVLAERSERVAPPATVRVYHPAFEPLSIGELV